MLNKLQKMRQSLKKKGKGFTLVELIVVIIIIAIIAAVAIPSITSFQDNARKSRIESEHRELVSAVQSAIGELKDPMNETDVQKIDLTSVLKYINKKDNKTAAEDLLATNDISGKKTVAHTIANGVLTSTFHPRGATNNDNDKTWTYDFNVNK